MRILITGSAGFIGTHLRRELDAAGHTTCGVDLNATKTHHDWRTYADDPNPYRFFRPDIVVHLAAKVGRLFGEDDVAATISRNAGLTAAVAQLATEHGARLVYASTSEVYGDQGAIQVNERDHCMLPHNIYGLSKRWGEEAAKLYAPNGLTVWRISMPYGPGLPAGRGRAAMINFLYNAHHGMPLTVHRGSERSWCWIGDTVRAMRLTIEQTDGGIFNIGRDDNATSMLDVAARACALAGADPELIELVDAPLRQTVVKRLATEKIRALGWRPEVDLDEGMRRTYEWVKTLPAPVLEAA